MISAKSEKKRHQLDMFPNLIFPDLYWLKPLGKNWDTLKRCAWLGAAKEDFGSDKGRRNIPAKSDVSAHHSKQVNVTSVADTPSAGGYTDGG